MRRTCPYSPAKMGLPSWQGASLRSTLKERLLDYASGSRVSVPLSLLRATRASTRRIGNYEVISYLLPMRRNCANAKNPVLARASVLPECTSRAGPQRGSSMPPARRRHPCWGPRCAMGNPQLSTEVDRQEWRPRTTGGKKIKKERPHFCGLSFHSSSSSSRISLASSSETNSILSPSTSPST